MQIYKFNSVFDHVEKTLYEYFGDNKAFANTLFILGYNVLDNLDFLRKQYPKYKFIIMQLEQLYTGSEWVNKKSYNILKSADEVWDYDYSNIQWMSANYKIKATFFPMMYTNALKVIQPIDEVDTDIDLLFYGYTNQRRAKLFYDLQYKFAGKLKFYNIYGAWGSELDSYISRAKIILNVHSNPVCKQEQVRMYYPVINGRCVISEKSPFNYFGKSIIECKYEDMNKVILNALKTETWKEIASTSESEYMNLTESYKQKLKIT